MDCIPKPDPPSAVSLMAEGTKGSNLSSSWRGVTYETSKASAPFSKPDPFSAFPAQWMQNMGASLPDLFFLTPMLGNPQLPNTLPPGPEATISYICVFTPTSGLRPPPNSAFFIYLLHSCRSFLIKAPTSNLNCPLIHLPFYFPGEATYSPPPNLHAPIISFMYLDLRFLPLNAGFWRLTSMFYWWRPTPRVSVGCQGGPWPRGSPLYPHCSPQHSPPFPQQWFLC